MTTPEGKIKVKVRELLKKYNVYYFQPVQMGYGAAGLDFHCVVCWKHIAVAFFIETKAPGKKPTDRQNILIADLEQRWNANVFVIENDTGLRKLEQWLMSIQDQSSLLKPRPFSTTTISQPETPQSLLSGFKD